MQGKGEDYDKKKKKCRGWGCDLRKIGEHLKVENLEHFGFYPGHPEDAGVGQPATSSNRQALPSKSWINSVHAAPLCKGRKFRLTPLDEKYILDSITVSVSLVSTVGALLEEMHLEISI